MTKISCISPIDSKILATRALLSDQALLDVISQAQAAQKIWAKTPLSARAEAMLKFLENMSAMNDEIIPELAKQMGRPVVFGGVMAPFRERVEYMVKIAESVLADYVPENSDGQDITRYIKRVPLGTVLVIAPWNYPFLTAVNGVVPALLAGNAVILKHAAQTLLVGERFEQAMRDTALPSGLFANVLLSHQQVADVLQAGRINHVTFTGSVAGGRAIEKAAAGTFTTMNLELGGKDAAYVCEDANLDLTATDLAEGAFYNSGQCCCGIERIYVAEKVFDSFVAALVSEVKKLKLGDPLDKTNTLGPMANVRFADQVRAQVAAAVAQGAKPLIDESLFPLSQQGTPYLAPQVLVNLDHSMEIMTEETFGPVVGIMAVKDDQEAFQLMNDSPYGLTASIWSKDQARAVRIADEIETGVVFMNRCDYVDPSLVWTGTKNTGRGAALSKYGFDALTRPKSYHLRRGAYCQL